MIKKVKEKPVDQRIEIDLTGPEGNAFYLLAKARQLTRRLHLDWNQVYAEMTREEDYEQLVKVFDYYFGEFVTLYR